jgi:hypothetical protein
MVLQLEGLLRERDFVSEQIYKLWNLLWNISGASQPSFLGHFPEVTSQPFIKAK